MWRANCEKQFFITYRQQAGSYKDKSLVFAPVGACLQANLRVRQGKLSATIRQQAGSYKYMSKNGFCPCRKQACKRIFA
jgi:hypothetical protein